jgi:hypothetical protein
VQLASTKARVKLSVLAVNVGAASFGEVTAASAISAATIVPSTRFAEATVISVGNAPVANLLKATAAEASMLALTIVPHSGAVPPD